MSGTILVLNAGSSSIKFQLFATGAGDRLDRRFKGQLAGIGTPHPRLQATDGDGRAVADRTWPADRAADVAAAQEMLAGWLSGQLGGTPAAIGHRVVHGGTAYTDPVLIDDAVLAGLEALVPLAPLHQPSNLAPIRSIRARRPGLPQVACFDTAFHRGHPEIADRFALPEHLYAAGVRRYGFHGLSYEFVAGRLPETVPKIAEGRIVVAHLGSGCSACAMVGRRSVDSTMSFTALDGLPMGTRPGQLDPGVVLYLMQQGMDAQAIEHLLYHESGLKGLSGLSGDVRELLASSSPAAARALDYFACRTAQAVAGLATAMGGLDGIVFTAGVGENAAPVRAAIAARLGWLGLELDPARNDGHGPLLSTDGSRVAACVIPTDEERMIARHTLAVLRGHERP